MAPKDKDTFANVISVCPCCERKQLLRVTAGIESGKVVYKVRCTKAGCDYNKSYSDDEFADFLASQGDVEMI